jgi:D-amino peptidase
MKIFISADIEGVAAITAPEEANPDSRETRFFQEQMTLEVKAACEGAIEAGATEIYVKDAHWTGRNINPRALPECVKLVRGWSGHPYSMMQELDKSFAATLFIGYHSRAGSGGNPLAHTMSGRVVAEMRINDRPASEFLLNTLTSTLESVPVAFLSGDQDLCAEVKAYNEHIVTVSTFKGIGQSTVSVHPDVVLRSIREGVHLALANDLKRTMRPLPEHFKVEIDYKLPREAYGRSFYPGARLEHEHTVVFETKDWFEALRMIYFTVK